MNNDQLLDEFRQSGALLEGHFILTSGRRSPIYMQSARVLMDPSRAERIASALAERCKQTLKDDQQPTVVLAPAMGGMIIGYELARQLGLPSIFVERVDGTFELRRGFTLSAQDRVIIAEDVITTGKSTRECRELIQKTGATIVGVTCLIDRSSGSHGMNEPVIALASLVLPTYLPEEVPPELAAIPPVKPGSRALTSN